MLYIHIHICWLIFIRSLFNTLYRKTIYLYCWLISNSALVNSLVLSRYYLYHIYHFEPSPTTIMLLWICNSLLWKLCHMSILPLSLLLSLLLLWLSICICVYCFVIVSVVFPIIINIHPHYDQKEWDIDINRDIINDMAMDQYLYIPFLGDEHPFTSYFGVHQGDRVLTHPHIYIYILLIPFISHSSFRRIISTLRTDLCKVGEALLTCAIEGAGSW